MPLLITLCTLTTSQAFTRIDPHTYHLVSYNKPIIVVDDYIQTKFSYDYGDQLIAHRDTYVKYFNSLLNTQYDIFLENILDTYLLLLRKINLKPVLYHSNIFVSTEQVPDVHCLISYNNIPLHKYMQSYPALLKYWTDVDKSFYSIPHFLAHLCARDFEQVSGLLPNYSERLFNQSNQVCEQLSSVTRTVIDSRCEHARFQPIHEVILSRKPRWDSSYTCGWPLISHLAKILGGECTSNVDLTSLKTNLREIQDFSINNTHIITDLESQLKIVNKRVGLHYNQLQELIKSLNTGHDNLLKALQSLTTSFEIATNDLAHDIYENKLAINYISNLFKIMDVIFDIRLSYMETLDAVINQHMYANLQPAKINLQLYDELNNIGYTIPTIDRIVPYIYTNINYYSPKATHFFNIEFDVLIPVVKLQHTKQYFESVVSPLPIISANGLETIYNTYQGSAICNVTHCLAAPVKGFCHETPKFTYCNHNYINTLQTIPETFTSHKQDTPSVIFIPPYTFYFPRNVTYYLNNRQYDALTGSILIVNCTTQLTIQDKTYKISEQLACFDTSFVDIQPTYVIDPPADEYTYDFANVSIPLHDGKLQHEYHMKKLSPIYQQLHTDVVDKMDQDLESKIDQIDTLISSKVSQLEIKNKFIQSQINSMHATAGSGIPWFWIIVIGIGFIALRLVTIF